MARRARVDRSPEQKLEIVLEGLESGNIAETCRRYEVAPNLYYRWKDEALQGATAALLGMLRNWILSGRGNNQNSRHKTPHSESHIWIRALAVSC